LSKCFFFFTRKYINKVEQTHTHTQPHNIYKAIVYYYYYYYYYSLLLNTHPSCSIGGPLEATSSFTGIKDVVMDRNLEVGMGAAAWFFQASSAAGLLDFFIQLIDIRLEEDFLTEHVREREREYEKKRKRHLGPKQILITIEKISKYHIMCSEQTGRER
jgi:hypothetical protein